MTEIEKVIKGLKTCYCPPSKCEDCPYDDMENCNDALCLDALVLLKEQEAVAPFYEEGEDFLNYFTKHTMGRCGHCKAPLPALEGVRSKFCWMCGRQVKWE